MKGFTLIETIVVMVITLILAVVLFLRWSPIERVRLDGAARKLAGDIRYAQKLAISAQMRAGLILDANGYGVYSIINAVPPLLANSPGDLCSSRPADNKFVVDFTETRCGDFAGVTLSFVTNAIAFDSIGKPVSAGGVALPTQAVDVNYKGVKQITIYNGTGVVSY